MPFYTLSGVRSSLAENGPSHCPEIYACYVELPEPDQKCILNMVLYLSMMITGLGPSGALELVYKTGRFMVSYAQQDQPA